MSPLIISSIPPTNFTYNCILDRYGLLSLLSIIMKLLISLVLLPFTVLASDKFPKMKPGGWELSMNIPEMKFPIKSTYCIDETTQNKLLQSSEKDMGSCETPRFTRSGDIFTTETTCLEGGRKANIISTMNFSGDTSFTSNIKVTSDDGTQTLIGSGKHLGECPTGMNPGDVRVMNFSRENIEAMMRQFK